MAQRPSRVQTGPSSSSAATLSTSTPIKLDKAGLYDLYQVKRTLDDEVISFLEANGYAAVTWTTDVKIVLGTLAVGAALYSHFNKREFPENRYLVLGCVILYIICACIISAIRYFIEGHGIFMGKPTKKAKAVGRTGKVQKIVAYSSFPKHGESTYMLTLSKSGKKEGEGATSSKLPYEKYFTTDGEFLATEFRKDVTEVLRSLGTGKKSQ